MARVQKFKVADPKNPTFSEKTRMLQGQLQRSLKAQDFKFTAFVAAARSEDYNHTMNPIPPGFTMQDGELDIEKLRNLINQVPKLSQLHKILEEQQFSQINRDIINLVFWVILYAQNIHQISVEEFMSKLPLTDENRCDRKPAHVFRVVARRQPWFNEIVATHNIRTSTGIYCSKFEGIFKLLVHEFKIMNSEYLLLRTDFDPAFSLSERVWENSEFFTEFRCVAVCSILEHNEKVEKYILNNAYSYLKIFDENLLLLNYLVLYEDETKAIKGEDPEQSWWKSKSHAILLGVLALLGVLVAVKATRSIRTGEPKFNY
ncbi:uncharacterized protein LOC119675896 [Teleopsis dalmanni]|uniref:uncharacterized protein LOC119675896 n=1 Tax=Teleopsis dalmanni TaxID=139649 RepID=UPI0018CE4415|nr:uncharacterized protein LOC119675896 [Teleopsis dalmanni]